ncbi:hypothetical protein D046_4127B, partial [Vibrio parahaemolyticus V-223/04]
GGNNWFYLRLSLNALTMR